MKLEDIDQKYILDDGHNIVPATLMEWAHWYEKNDRHVASTYVGPYWISTVFLGLDHRFGSGGPPILFETMVFKRNGETGEMNRYATWDEAKAGHEHMVAKYKFMEGKA